MPDKEPPPPDGLDPQAVIEFLESGDGFLVSAVQAVWVSVRSPDEADMKLIIEGENLLGIPFGHQRQHTRIAVCERTIFVMELEQLRNRKLKARERLDEAFQFVK